MVANGQGKNERRNQGSKGASKGHFVGGRRDPRRKTGERHSFLEKRKGRASRNSRADVIRAKEKKAYASKSLGNVIREALSKRVIMTGYRDALRKEYETKGCGGITAAYTVQRARETKHRYRTHSTFGRKCAPPYGNSHSQERR